MKIRFLSILLAFLTMFVMAGLFNGLVVNELVSENIDSAMLREAPNLGLIAFGYALLALLMTLIYPRVVSPASYSVRSGFLFGMVAGIFWLLPQALVMHGIYRFPSMDLLIDPAWALLEQGIAGAIIGLIYAKFSKPDNSSF
ncbi:MAG: hypothetical protein OER98_13965 [Gammaproteobacteria bacterium]|nr:hypothetical protein [Gammaproteobacteria bacterium]